MVKNLFALSQGAQANILAQNYLTQPDFVINSLRRKRVENNQPDLKLSHQIDLILSCQTPTNFNLKTSLSQEPNRTLRNCLHNQTPEHRAHWQ